MANYAPIKRNAGWFRFERKRFEVEVKDAAGEPLDISASVLEWRLLRHAGSEVVYLELNSDDFEDPEGHDNNIAVFTIPEDAYTDIPARWYYHELWDRQSHLLLAYGGALLQKARAE